MAKNPRGHRTAVRLFLPIAKNTRWTGVKSLDTLPGPTGGELSGRWYGRCNSFSRMTPRRILPTAATAVLCGTFLFGATALPSFGDDVPTKLKLVPRTQSAAGPKLVIPRKNSLGIYVADRREIITRLYKDFGVRVFENEASKEVFAPVFLQETYFYLKQLGLDAKTRPGNCFYDMVAAASEAADDGNGSGPQLVTTRESANGCGKTLTIQPNAGEYLQLPALLAAQKQVDQNFFAQLTDTFTIDSTNTFYLQLADALLTREGILGSIKKNHGLDIRIDHPIEVAPDADTESGYWIFGLPSRIKNAITQYLFPASTDCDEPDAALSTTPEAAIPERDRERQFTKRESLMLMKAFMDLPPEIVQAMKLKKVGRMAPGLRSPSDPDAAGTYNPITQTILLTDLAFGETSGHQGDGTFYHELGHAYWAAMEPKIKTAFIDLSWRLDTDGKTYRRIDGFNQFVSEYAQKDEGEDFAESFSAYVNDPQNLMRTAPIKYLFLRDQVFKTVEYRLDGNQKVKIQIESKMPDTLPPYMTGSLKSGTAIALSRMPLDHEGNDTRIRVNIDRSLIDDLSGIDQVYFQFIHDHDPSVFALKVGISDRTPVLSGPLVIEGAMNSKKMASGFYHLSMASFEDQAGNEHRLGQESDLGFDFAGVNDSVQGPKPANPLTERVLNETVFRETSRDTTAVKGTVTLPMPHPTNLNLLYLTWWHPGMEVSITQLATQELLLSKPGDPAIVLTTNLPNTLDRGRLELRSVRLRLDATATSAPDAFSESFDESSRPTVTLDGKQGFSAIRLDLNRLSLRAKDEAGGEKTVTVRVPISNLGAADKIAGEGILVSPSGLEFKTTDVSVIRANGQSFVEYEFRLGAYREEGSYRITDLSVRKRHPIELQDDAPLMGEELLETYDFNEVHILKTFQVGDFVKE